jgi:hypothetical protein
MASQENGRVAVCIVILAACTATATAQLKPSTRMVAQPDAPVAITSYNAAYRERSQYSTEGIHHSVKFQNKGTKTVVAVSIGLVSFDVWNEYMERTNGLSTDTIQAGKEDSGTWVAAPYRGFSFLTGVAFVHRVRFDDGSIWVANNETVLEELRKIEKDFDESRLKKDQPPPGKN